MKLTKKVLKEIDEVSDNKYYKVTWLKKRIEENHIKTEDIYKFKGYFETFEKHKRKFECANIHEYGSAYMVSAFVQECIDIQERNIGFADIENKEEYCSQIEIEKLTQHNLNYYLGLFKGYQVFCIGNESNEAFKDSSHR